MIKEGYNKQKRVYSKPIVVKITVDLDNSFLFMSQTPSEPMFVKKYPNPNDDNDHRNPPDDPFNSPFR